MNKSTLPVAVILAASAAPVQAQDAVASYSKKQLQEDCRTALIEVGTYPDAVKPEYVGKLSTLLAEINALAADATEEQLAAKNTELQTIKADAKKAEQKYAASYYALLDALDEEAKAKTAADTAVEGIEVPSVKEEYESKLKAITTETYDDKLKDLYNDSEAAKAALTTVNANIAEYNEIAKNAATDDEAAKTGQATAKENLLDSITAANTAATAAKTTVEGYIAYDNQSTDVAAIDAAITALGNLETQVNKAAEALRLTKDKQEKISNAVTAQETDVSNTLAAAETAAKAAAEAYSEKAVENLPGPFDPINNDDPLMAVNSAIQAAKDKAEALKDIIVKANRTELEKELEGLLNTAQAAYNTAVKNLEAYNAGKEYIDTLQATYDEQNLELQELKINKKINDDVYTIANNSLNGVAAKIQEMTQTNEANYADKKYENGTDDEDYTSLTGTLTTDEIKQIVTDAKNASSAYDDLAKNLAEAKTDADKIVTDNQAIIDELDAAYKDASAAVKNYAKGKMSQDDAQKAIDKYNKTITDAQADVTAYNDAMTLINNLQAYLNAVSLPELAEDTTYPDADLIKDLASQKETFQTNLNDEKKNIENSFNASPRTIQQAYKDLQDNGIVNDIPAWNNNAQSAYEDYKTWLATQSDVVIYNNVKAQVDKLQKKLEGASSDMLGYSEDKAAIEALYTELAAHENDPNHTGCSANSEKWTDEIKRISKSIDDHQTAYNENKTAYDNQLAIVNGLYSDQYYVQIKNKTDKQAVDDAIEAAKTALDDYNDGQSVIENQTEIDKQISDIKNLIAAKYLKKTIQPLATSYNTAKKGLEGEGLDPSSYYSTLLEGYNTDRKALAKKYNQGQVTYGDIDTEEKAINALKADIEAVVPAAEANLEAYNTQKAAQQRAKTEWASYYSQVGTLYSGEQFVGAQALYQGDLNDCLALISGYDTQIEECYNNGTSVDFGKATDENIGYDAAIDENRAKMEKVLKDATANKNAYTGQVVDVNELNSSFDGAAEVLDEQIKDAEAALNSAETEEDKATLNERIAELREYKTQLDKDIMTRIQNLEKTVLEKVNAGESVGYNKDFDTENIAVSEAIQEIVDKAKGIYDDAVKEHNRIVKANFEAEYKTATGAYNTAVYDISKYASYQHALDANGVSGYAASIETANETLFPLYEELKGIKAEFNAKFSNASRFDAEQKYRTQVKAVEEKIATALDTFLKATQQTALDNGYTKNITALTDRYDEIVSDISGYTYSEDAKAAFDETEGGKVAEVKKTYENALGTYTAPQVIDDLNFDINNGVKADMEKAYSEAAKADVNAHISEANTIIAEYQKKLNEDYPLSTSLKPAIEDATAKVTDAGDALAASTDVPADHDKIIAPLSGIKTSLEDAEKQAVDEQAEKEADNAIAKQFDAYAKQIKEIAEGNHGTDKLGIDDYKSPFKYADKLTDLLNAGDDAVEAANAANKAAKTQGYNDTDRPSNIVIGTKEVVVYKHNSTGEIISVDAYNKLNRWERRNYSKDTVDEPIYYPGTAKEYIDEKIAAAQTALDNIVKKVAELEATDATAIVDGMYDKVQKTLIPLYNRAVANGGDETELETVYDEITTLLASLDTSKLTAEQIEAAASEENQADVDTKIAELSKKIADLDTELQAYNSLTGQLNDVKAELDAVKADIAASEFADDLNTAFSSDIAGIDSKISKTEQNINADHANNRCDKETANVKAEDIEAISQSIKSLATQIDEKTKELQKAKEDAATRAANATAYDTEKEKLNGLNTTLTDAWDALCADNVDVWTEFNDTKNEIAGQITAALSALDEEKAAADAEPRNINTADAEKAYTDITAAIEKMSKDAADRQGAYNAQLAAVQQSIADLAAAYGELEISDIAAAEAEVIAARQAMEKAIADLQGKEITPDNIADVEAAVAAAEEQLEALKTLIEQKTYIPGDINETGKVDMDDLLLIRNIVLGRVDTTGLTENQVKAADLNGDGQFTIADLVMLNNIYVYGNPSGPAVSYTKGQPRLAEPGALAMQIAAERMDISLNSAMPYVAIQMDVTLPAGVVLNELAFAGDTEKVLVATNVLDNGACRIVMYSADGSAMLPGAANLLHLRLAGEGNGIVAIDNIIAATSDGTSYSLAAISGDHNIITGINAAEAEGENNYSVFSTNGVVSKTLKKGVNIVRDAAGRVKKILVK